ncbi:helix-turn-helix domain-containing protein [Streptomyces sp. CA-294286]|uniref:helix-turn-helix domain-containing protein n=1 Tax=Streptomyces sp. CA-294286 TaxID=3240070 RepID=UPI003D89FD5C
MSDSEGEAVRPMPTTFVERLNRLIDVYHPPHRGPYSDKELSALVSERGLGTLSHTHLKNLRTGKTRSPGMDVLEILSKLFGVSPEYWFDANVAAASVAELERLCLMRDAGIEKVLLRMAGLSDGGVEMVLGVVEEVRKFEGLSSSK